MIIAQTASSLAQALEGEKLSKGRSIGFVPTMGALHEGHLSLLGKSKGEGNISVCSIFVNPAQFNNKEDLQHYPRQVENDIALLENSGCDVLFLPSEREVYPDAYITKHFSLGYLENIFEGKFRPGHFQGVCKVVDRLLDLVKPNDLYMGQKDYQQCMVIAKLLEIRNKATDPTLHVEPTLREENGLAMSSRNLRLSEIERERASVIFRVLTDLKQHYAVDRQTELEQGAASTLERSGFVVDYVSIVDATTLLPIESAGHKPVALTAATLGKVRLIDNMLL